MQLRTVNTTADLEALLDTARTNPSDLTDDQQADLIELVDTLTAALEPSIRVWANVLVDTVKAADYLLRSLPPIVLQIVLRPTEAIAAALAASDRATPTGTITLPSDPTPVPEPTPTPEPAVTPEPVPTPDEVPDSAPDTTSLDTDSTDLASRPQYATVR